MADGSKGVSSASDAGRSFAGMQIETGARPRMAAMEPNPDQPEGDEDCRYCEIEGLEKPRQKPRGPSRTQGEADENGAAAAQHREQSANYSYNAFVHRASLGTDL
ncbi:MAG: hypothetical protein EKK40_18380 [Bradyrhizobiaceae bacterium]|nr:MAG: hypothetical protein EKK40_18380 [Bradyrhizobiaceae bacterium]